MARKRKSDNSSKLANKIATLVEEDIRARDLRPGDRYLTTSEVAIRYSISTRSANKAMKHLASRNLLARKPGAGTVVGPGLPASESEETPGPIDILHILIRKDYYFAEPRRIETLILGLAHGLPDCAIQLNFVPAFGELQYVERLFEANAGATSRSGYLILVKSPQLQRFFERQRAPSILLGTPFQGIKNIAWLDKDQGAIGRLIVRRFLESGHRRIGVILRDRRGGGDDLMMDAISEELFNAGMSSGGLVVRSVPADPPLIDLVVTSLLDPSLDPSLRPQAILCRNRAILNSVIHACDKFKLAIGTDLALAIADPPVDDHDVISVPCLRPTPEINSVTEGRKLAEMFTALCCQTPPASLFQVIPVTL